MNRRYPGFIDTTRPTGPAHGIGVPGEPTGLPGHLDGLRRALEPIELGLGDRVAWELYADLDVAATLGIALKIHGKKALNTKRKPRKPRSPK